jgi:hypothetical protein
VFRISSKRRRFRLKRSCLPVHESRIASVQKAVELRVYFRTASVGSTEASNGRLARVGLIDRSHSPRLPRVSFERHFGALMTHALCAEGETPDWRSPPSVGSRPFAIAGPCARVPGRYAEPRNVKNLVAHPWSWAIGSSTSAAQRSFDMVVCRRKARPFVLITKLGLQENGRPSPNGTGLGPGSRSRG